MKKLIALFAILACVLSLNAKVLKVGTNATYPPFEFIDDQNKVAGFDIDLMNALGKKLGYEVEVINMSFDGLIPALKAGKIDAVIAGMSSTPQRKKAVDFTNPYFNTTNIFIKKAGNEALKSKADLDGKKIGVQLGTIQETTAREIKGAKVMPMEDLFTAIMALKAGKVDVALADNLVGISYIKKNKDIESFIVEPDGSEGFSIAFDKDKNKELVSKINQTLEEFKKDGTFDKMLEKYNLK